MRTRSLLTGLSAAFLFDVMQRVGASPAPIASEPLEPGLVLSCLPEMSDHVPRYCLCFVDEGRCAHLYVFYGWQAAVDLVDHIDALDDDLRESITDMIVDSGLPSESTEPTCHLSGLEAELMTAAVKAVYDQFGVPGDEIEDRLGNYEEDEDKSEDPLVDLNVN